MFISFYFYFNQIISECIVKKSLLIHVHTYSDWMYLVTLKLEFCSIKKYLIQKICILRLFFKAITLVLRHLLVKKKLCNYFIMHRSKPPPIRWHFVILERTFCKQCEIPFSYVYILHLHSQKTHDLRTHGACQSTPIFSS